MKTTVALLILLTALILHSCSETDTPLSPPMLEETSVRFALPAANPTEFQLRAERAELVITGSDMDTLTFPLTVTDSGIAGTITALMAGTARTFTITVYDSDGRIQYEGSRTLDVDAGAMTSLPIRVKKILGGRRGDSLALVAIDNASDNSLWDWQTPIHTWQGVTCEALDTARVTGLSMTESLLSEIPNEIGYLTELTTLSLQHNSLSSLPGEIALLQKVRSVDLTGNKFNSLPTVLCSLKTMTTLLLAKNSIRTLPTALEQCTNLYKLDLSSNALSGTFSLPKTLSDLSILVLTNNNIDSLDPAICSLPALQELYLEQNNMTELTSSIGSMGELLILKLNENKLSTLPVSIAKCGKLQHLELRKNSLVKLPGTLWEMPTLLSLDLEENALTSLGESVGTLENLQNLNLCKNKLPFGELAKIPLDNGFTYSPMDTIGTTMNLTNQSSFQIGISVSGADNMYQWYRDNMKLNDQNSDSLYVTQSGTYHCVISSKSFISVDPVTKETIAMEIVHRPIIVTIADTEAPASLGAYLYIKGQTPDNPVDDTCFNIADNVTAKEDITITITSLPEAGFIESVNNEKIQEGYSFTLKEYNAKNNILYTNEDSTRIDSIGFTLTDLAGNISDKEFLKISYF